MCHIVLVQVLFVEDVLGDGAPVGAINVTVAASAPAYVLFTRCGGFPSLPSVPACLTGRPPECPPICD